MYILLKVDSYNKTVSSNYLTFLDNRLHLNYVKLSHDLNSPIKLSIKQNQKFFKLINKLFLNKSGNYLLDINNSGFNLEIGCIVATKISESIDAFHVINKKQRVILFNNKINEMLTGNRFESKLYGISNYFDNTYSHKITERFENWFLSKFGQYHETKKNYFELCEASLLAYLEFN